MKGKIFFPSFEEDWDALVAHADGADREALWNLKILAELSDDLSGSDSTAERLGWVLIWARAWGFATGLQAATRFEIPVVVEMLDRALMEYGLQLLTLSDVSRGDDDHSGSIPSRCTDALRGFLAWSIWEDLQNVSARRKGENIEAVGDPAPARDLLRDLGDMAGPWQAAFGEIEVTSDQEAEFDRERMDEQLYKREQELKHWLSDPALDPWREKIEGLGARCSLDQVFGRRPRNVWSQMKGLGLQFGYPQYKRGSQVIHGSSFEHFMIAGNDGFAPRVADGAKGEERLCELARGLRSNLLLVKVFKDWVWNADSA